MARLMISTALAGLLISAGAAMAQPPDRGDRGNGQHEQRGDRGDRGDRGGDRRAQPQVQAQQQAQPQAPQPRTQANPPSRGGFLNFGAQTGQTAQQPDRRERTDNRPSGGDRSAPAANIPRNGMRDSDRDRRDFDRGGRDSGRDFRSGAGRNNFTQFNRNFSAPRRFRAPTYNRPRGWYSHRWVYGEILPSLFWTSSYWIDDYFYYGLEPPPPGTIWVRDGTDALLIDRYNGEVIQVVYDVFY